MLIIDYSQLVVASYMAMAFGSAGGTEVDIDIVRHVSLDGIRLVNSKFRRKYGDPILAIDSSKGSWRKQAFPYYKANRSEARKKSDIDWKELLRQMNTIKEEIKQTFPYKVIEAEHAEADDIIGVLTRKAIKENSPVMIISGDKDFIQLQVDTNLVQQWDKRFDRYIGAESPQRYLFEHVLKGDRGDGIPNILSPGNSFVNKIRQKPMSQKKLDEFWDDKQQLKQFPRFIENLKLVDLNFTPRDMQDQIIKQFDNYVVNDKSKLHQYFIDKRMKQLYSNIGDF